VRSLHLLRFSETAAPVRKLHDVSSQCRPVSVWQSRAGAAAPIFGLTVTRPTDAILVFHQIASKLRGPLSQNLLVPYCDLEAPYVVRTSEGINTRESGISRSPIEVKLSNGGRTLVMAKLWLSLLSLPGVGMAYMFGSLEQRPYSSHFGERSRHGRNSHIAGPRHCEEMDDR